MKYYFSFLLLIFIALNAAAQDTGFRFVKSFGKSGSVATDVKVPIGISVKDKVWVVDQDRKKLIAYDKTGNYLKDFDVPTRQGLAGLYDVETDADGNLYVSCIGGIGVLKFDEDGKLLQTINTDNTNGGKLVVINGIAFDKDQNLYVSNSASSSRRIVIFDKNGNYLKYLTFNYDIGDIAVDSRKNIYVTNRAWLDGAVNKYDSTGNLLWTVKTYDSIVISSPSGLRYVASTGQLLVCDLDNSRFLVLTDSGTVTSSFDLKNSRNSQGYMPMDIDVDETGEKIYFTGLTGSFSSDNEMQIWEYNDIVTSVENLRSEALNIDVFPNPATSYIQIKTSGNDPSGITNIIVCDLTGRHILNTNFYKNKVEARLDISMITNGVYLLKVTSGNNSSVKKIVKN